MIAKSYSVEYHLILHHPERWPIRYWYRPKNSNRYHIYRGRNSLCHKWYFLGEFDRPIILKKEHLEIQPVFCKECHKLFLEFLNVVKVAVRVPIKQ